MPAALPAWTTTALAACPDAERATAALPGPESASAAGQSEPPLAAWAPPFKMAACSGRESPSPGLITVRRGGGSESCAAAGDPESDPIEATAELGCPLSGRGWQRNFKPRSGAAKLEEDGAP